MLTRKTSFFFIVPPGSGIKLEGQKVAAPQFFRKKDLNFEKLGIGGMDDQFDEIYERMLLPRALPEMAKKLESPKTRGLLLYGPPGTGLCIHIK